MTTELIIEYCIYFIIIVIGILILCLMRRKNRLPNHHELKTRLEAWRQQLNDLAVLNENKPLSNFDFYKKLSKLLFQLDKLAYQTALMAEKERDMEISEISLILEGVLNVLEPYKSGKKQNDGENAALRAASENVVRAIKLTEQILLRDKAYKARKKI